MVVTVMTVGFPLTASAEDAVTYTEYSWDDRTKTQYFLAGLPSSLDSKLSNDELYELSVRDAVFADEDEIMPQSTSLRTMTG